MRGHVPPYLLCSLRTECACIRTFCTIYCETSSFFLNRGGVDDTRLEAKTRDKKKFEDKAKDRPSRGQEQKCLRPKPRTKAQVFSKQKRKKKVCKNFFQTIYKTLTIQKILLSSSRGRAIFQDLRLRTSKCVLQRKDVLEDFTSALELAVCSKPPSKDRLIIVKRLNQGRNNVIPGPAKVNKIKSYSSFSGLHHIFSSFFSMFENQ